MKLYIQQVKRLHRYRTEFDNWFKALSRFWYPKPRIKGYLYLELRYPKPRIQVSETSLYNFGIRNLELLAPADFREGIQNLEVGI